MTSILHGRIDATFQQEELELTVPHNFLLITSATVYKCAGVLAEVKR